MIVLSISDKTILNDVLDELMFLRKIISLLCLCFVATASYAKAPVVVTTIKPIHALASAVMEGAAKPELIVTGRNSPHGFRLKPSHIRIMKNADYVFYVDPKIEGFLNRLLTQKDSHQFKALSAIGGLKLHTIRIGDYWQQCHDDDHQDGTHHHAEYGYDPHIWLSYHNAKIIVDYIAATLSAHDNDNRETYLKNAENYKKRIDNIDFSDLKKLENKNFIVFHDAYQYFEKDHNLSAVGAVTIDPQLPAKPRRLSALRKHLKDHNVRCVFKEPQFSNKLIDTVINDSKVHIGVLDPLGGDLEAGVDLYIQLLENMRESFNSCFETAYPE